jgi:hydrogenase maturation protease
MKYDAIKEAKSQAVDRSILVIGYGNPFRRDDGAGPVLAERLAQCWSNQGISTRALTNTQLMPEMADEIAEDKVKAVVFVDTRVNGFTSAIQISQVDVDAKPSSLGHQFDPATLLLYAALLYGRYPRAWLVTVPGVDFAHGQGFSARVEEVLDDASSIADLLRAVMKECVSCMN